MGRKSSREQQYTYRAEQQQDGQWFGQCVEEPQLMIFDQTTRKNALRAIQALHREQMDDYRRFYGSNQEGVFY